MLRLSYKTFSYNLPVSSICQLLHCGNHLEQCFIFLSVKYSLLKQIKVTLVFNVIGTE